MDWILTEYVKKSQDRQLGFVSLGPTITDFVIKTGYKDEPDTDEVDKPLPRRTTPLHCAARCRHFWAVRDLFKIYNRYDVNYTDEFGYTHFHAACEFGCYKIVKEFLQFGQDSNLLVQETGDTPLHLAVSCGERKVVKLLLRNGADPSSVNAKGSTALHRLFSGLRADDDLAEIFFRISDEKHLTVQVDARNNEGQTALQLAVANFMPNTVKVLLDRGADLSKFVFPAEKYFHNCNDAIKWYGLEWSKSGALSVVERLEKRGYKQNRGDALKLMKLFAEHLCETMSRGFFQPWALESLLVLTRHELPILCCEKIIEKLMNEDMLRLCLAADIITNESNENM
ncbi:unnamed protein product [Trichogramma brassicae]|uniref:Uncharacterized protein n=1 Tax=Trichogramma brassicae TaxID=86971 RepID=A0A6H5J501_9HYME|nr:unnamed protein product [Trichogramma brassicae]